MFRPRRGRRLPIRDRSRPTRRACDGVWYPTSAAASDQRLNLFSQHVAPGAPVAGGGHALVVMSHGHGGSLDNHYDTALALAHAGFVAASATHTGDNYRDLVPTARNSDFRGCGIPTGVLI